MPGNHRTLRWKAIWLYASSLTVCVAIVTIAVVAARNGVGSAGSAVRNAGNMASLDGLQRSATQAVKKADGAAVVRQRPKSERAARVVIVPVLISRAADTGLNDPLPDGGQEASATDAIDGNGRENGDLDLAASTKVWSPQRTDTFRTVCVRMCDGAYFPVSFATTADRFEADAARCKSDCGSQARLFVVKPDGEPEDMVDVRGNAYGLLPTAFKFRTTYDSSCTCRGQPWEAAERETYRQEAIAMAAVTATLASAPAAAAERQRGSRRDLQRDESGNNPRVAVSRETVTVRSLRGPGDVAILTPSGSLVGQGLLHGQSQPTGRPESMALIEQPRAAGDSFGKSARSTTRGKTGAAFAPEAATVHGVVRPIARVGGVRKSNGSVGATKAVGKGVLAGRGSRTGDTMQRVFKPTEYWRLSYWEPKF